jgi:membrane protein YdbS with pleckstrin-like domain
VIQLNHYYRLRKRAWLLRFAYAVTIGAGVILCFMGAAYFLGIPIILFRVGLGCAAVLVVTAAIRLHRFSYAFGEKSMIVRCGALFSGHDIIPYHHIASAYVTRSFAGRWFGLCLVHIYVPRSQGLRVSGNGGEMVLLCARRGSDELIFPTTIEDACDIVRLVRARMKQHH